MFFIQQNPKKKKMNHHAQQSEACERSIGTSTTYKKYKYKITTSQQTNNNANEPRLVVQAR